MTRDEFLNLKPGDQIGLKGVTYQVVGWFQQSPTLRVAGTGRAARLVLHEDDCEVAEAVKLRPGDSMYVDAPRCIPVVNQSGETVAVLADPTPGQANKASLSQIFGQGYVLHTAECPGCHADAYVLADSEPRGPEATVVYYGCLSCGYEDSDAVD
jgi:hypothetical protein